MAASRPAPNEVGLATVVREWGRIGCVGFGGPPAHIALLRQLCVERRGWLERARLRGRGRGLQPAAGPGLDAARDLLRLARSRPRRRARRRPLLHRSRPHPDPRARRALPRLAAAVGPRRGRRRRRRGRGGRRAGRLEPRSRRAARGRTASSRWALYLLAGAASAATLGPWLVLVLLGCGAIELVLQRTAALAARARSSPRPTASSGGLLALAGWRSRSARSPTAAGFVIIPLMQADAVGHYHWLTSQEFLNAVALGQVTPGPVVAHRRRRRLRRGRGRRRRSSRRSSRSRRRSRSSCSAASASTGCGRTRTPPRSSRAPAPPRSARSSAPRCRSRARCRCRGSTRVLAGGGGAAARPAPRRRAHAPARRRGRGDRRARRRQADVESRARELAPHRRDRGRRAGPPLGGAALQRPRPEAEPGRQRLGAGRGAAQAAARSDAEPRRDGQGLRGARARHLRRGDAGARGRHLRAGPGRRRPRPRASSARRSGGCSPSPRPTRT